MKADTGISEGKDEKGENDDEEEEGNLTPTAMELALKPHVLETFDKIAKTYKRFEKVQVLRVEAALKHQELTPQQEKRYQKLRDELAELVKDVQLHNSRIEALVDQLYGINRRLIGLEGRLLRLADAHGVARADFIKIYVGCELDPRWLSACAGSRARAGPRSPAKSATRSRVSASASPMW